MPNSSLPPFTSASRRDILRFGAAGLASATFATLPFAGMVAARAEEVIRLAPYDPSSPAGERPNLPPAVAYMAVGNAELFVSVGKAFESASRGRGLTFLSSVFDGDETKFVSQFDGFLARGVGGMFLTPSVDAATRPAKERALAQGIFLCGFVQSTVHQVVNYNQYDGGYEQGRAAVKWIKANLHSKAYVANFHEDHVEFLRPRHHGILAALKEGGDQVELVSDISLPTLTEEAGLDATNSLLQAHPELNVAIGGSGLIRGVYAAFAALGRKNDPTVYLSGMSPGLAELELIRHGTVYRAGVVQPYEVWAYAGAQSAADWLDGKSVPIGLTGPSLVLTDAASIDAFIADMNDPAGVFADSGRRDKYLRMYGNISYATRDRFLRGDWAPA